MNEQTWISNGLEEYISKPSVSGLEYVKTEPEWCFKHIECRGADKCQGLLFVYWNRFLDWLIRI